MPSSPLIDVGEAGGVMTLAGQPVHASVTLDRILEGARRSMFGTEDDGICVACGEDQSGVEPDAERYPCECCERPCVYGTEQLLLLGVAQ